MLAAQQRRDRWGTAGCSGRGDGDTRTDGARQGQNSPLMQVWEPRGASPPRGLGTDIEAMSTRDSPGPPALGSRTNTTDVQRKEEVAGRCIACLLSLLARPQFSLGHASSNCLPSPMAVPQLPEVSSSQLGLEWRRNPRAALPAAHPGHPHHRRQLPLALLAQAWGSVGAGRSPQKTALCCGCPSSIVPSPQGQGHAGGTVQGGPGVAQPGQGPSAATARTVRSCPQAPVGRS